MADLPVSFQFAVAFGRSARDPEAAFREVSGIGPEIEVEAVSEGGENRFVHQLPKGAKYPRLVLKRGSDGETLAMLKKTADLSTLRRHAIRIDQPERAPGVNGRARFRIDLRLRISDVNLRG